MSEKTGEVPLLADPTYAHTLVTDSIHAEYEYGLHQQAGAYLWFYQTLPLNYTAKKMDFFFRTFLFYAQGIKVMCY